MDQLECQHLATITLMTASYSSDHISVHITSEFTALKHSFSTTAVVHHVEYQFVTKLQLT